MSREICQSVIEKRVEDKMSAMKSNKNLKFKKPIFPSNRNKRLNFSIY